MSREITSSSDAHVVVKCGGSTGRRVIASGGRVNPNWVKPEKIASVALFPASDGASAIGGEAIDVFGKTNPLFRK